jgi:DNA modification methylase
MELHNLSPKKLEHWPLDRLIPYDRNARTHSTEQVEQIAASIREFGFTNPILVDKDSGIIAGHGRLAAAKIIGLETVPVIVLPHLTDAQRRAYILADNKLALNAGWDEAMLAQELKALMGEDFDLSLIGFSDDELSDLLEDFDDGLSAGSGDEEAVPETPINPTSRMGDLWILGNHRVICGDSTSSGSLEKLLGQELAECLWTDPPYNVAYEGTAGKIKNDDMGDSEFRKFLYDAFVNAFSFMKPGGAAYVAHADTEGLNFRAAFIEAGFKLSSCVIWKKNSLVLGRSDYQWQHEPILYGWKEGAAHRWYGARNKTTIQEFDGGVFEQIADQKWQINIGQQTLIVEGKDIAVTEAYPSVVLEEKPKRNGEHPTMKPVALIERFLNNSTKKNDVVLDLFGGSGTTMIACEKLGRSARLVELDEKFCDVIVKRWQEYTGKKAIHAETGKTFDEIK